MGDHEQARVTLRTPWLLFGWLLSLVGCLVGIVTASTGDVVALLVGGAIAVGTSWMLVRIPFMRVTASEAGLTNHGVLRKRHVRRGEIAEVALEQTDDKVVGQVFAPVVRLHGDGELVLGQLSAYSTSARVQRSRVGRQTECLRRIVG